jgi:hypothetical protein
MHQIEIEHVEPQLLQAGIEGAAHRVGREIFVPDLCRHMQLVARDAACGNRSADLLLIGVHLRGVEMAIAERKRALDRGAAGIALHAEGAEAEPRHSDALGFESVHGNSLKLLHRHAQDEATRVVMGWFAAGG